MGGTVHMRRTGMKVLITGGYGFIGSHVAERFFNEGHEVFIIDNLSSGKKENITFKHEHYRVSVIDSCCEQVFQAYNFDIVVHLAAQVSVAKSIINPRLDTEINTVGLVNMLSLSHKYNVKKFIFASSAAVYGMNEKIPLTEDFPCSPISPYGISKWIGESYCQKWKELYGLDSVVFRFSNVYGPRQSNEGEGGVVSIFLDSLLKGKPLEVFGDGEQTRDFIYVTDVADAIYKASYSNLNGVYNLSTQSECNLKNLIKVMANIHGDLQVTYSPAKQGDIYKSKLSNEKLRNSLNWSPIYGMEKGIEQTYNWLVETEKEEQKVLNPVLI